MQKPYNGPEDEYCPQWQKLCKKVCPTCKWYDHIRGMNPQTGEEIDRWDCAIALLPLLSIEVASQVRQGAAATESFRNDVVNRVSQRISAIPVVPLLAERR